MMESMQAASISRLSMNEFFEVYESLYLKDEWPFVAFVLHFPWLA